MARATSLGWGELCSPASGEEFRRTTADRDLSLLEHAIGVGVVVKRLVVVAFPDSSGAGKLQVALRPTLMPQRGNPRLFAEAVAIRERSGRVTTRHEVTLASGPEAERELLWALLVVLLVQGPLGGKLWGVPTRVLWQRLIEEGMDEGFLKQVIAAIPPAGSALFLLMESSVVGELEPWRSRTVGRVLLAPVPVNVDSALGDELAREAPVTFGAASLGEPPD